MGCTKSIKKQDTEVERYKEIENKTKNLFYATTEFDLSTSESENEHEMFSTKSITTTNNKSKLITTKADKITGGFMTTNDNSSTTSNVLINRLGQTHV